MGSSMPDSYPDMARSVPSKRYASVAESKCGHADECAPVRGSLAEILWWLESEALAERSDVVSVDLTQLVAGVVLQGELRTFALN